MNADHARRAIIEHTRRLAESAAAAGPGTVVPTAPEWTVTDLVAHVGQTEHWVAEMVERRITDPMQLPTEMAELPADPAEWPAWLAEAARRVTDALSGDALTAPVFNAAGDDRTGGQFWLASVLNEAVVHGADGAHAAGRPVDVDPAIAATLISNHFAMLTSPTWEMQRAESAQAVRGKGETLQWTATDGAGGWFVEQRPEGAAWQLATREADVTVSAPAGTLLLILTRRLPLDEADVAGDAGLARHWLDNTAHIAD